MWLFALEGKVFIQFTANPWFVCLLLLLFFFFFFFSDQLTVLGIQFPAQLWIFTDWIVWSWQFIVHVVRCGKNQPSFWDVFLPASDWFVECGQNLCTHHVELQHKLFTLHSQAPSKEEFSFSSKTRFKATYWSLPKWRRICFWAASVRLWQWTGRPSSTSKTEHWPINFCWLFLWNKILKWKHFQQVRTTRESPFVNKLCFQLPSFCSQIIGPVCNKASTVKPKKISLKQNWGCTSHPDSEIVIFQWEERWTRTEESMGYIHTVH